MRLLQKLTTALPCLAGVASAGLIARDETLAARTNEYIVMFDADSASMMRGSNTLEEAGMEVIKTYDSPLFTGIALKSVNGQKAVEALPGVQRVWPNNLVLMEPEKVGRSFSDDAASANYTQHISTGVAAMHAAGIFGKGVKIGVVDTGIDYTHPALGGGFGEGFKVAGGYDFVGDGNWPDSGDKEPDEDPRDGASHGTHVAGIIGGKSDYFSGVAPEASLYAYKVFSQAASTDDATLIESFLRAADDGMDIITASIGSNGGWEDNAWAFVASRIAEEGIVVTIAAGNSGSIGSVYGSSGSSGKYVIGVASVEGESAANPSIRVNFNHRCVTNTTLIGYIPSVVPFEPRPATGWPIVPISNETHALESACEPFEPGAFNFTGKIPLVRRGGCPMQQKQENLNALGARFILLYNDEQPLAVLGTTNYQSYVGLIEAHSGEAIVEAVNAGVKVTADFHNYWLDQVSLPRSYAGVPSTFTSWGGLYDMQLKPDIAAPGGEIYSTLPRGLWAAMSGTSMATPYVAGVVALYISVHGGRSVHGKDFAKQVMKRVISSGVSRQWWDDASFVAPPTQVGTGLIDAYKLINYTTSLDFWKIELNDTANFNAAHEITVTNGGSDSVKYTFDVQDAAGMETYYDDNGQSSSSPRLKTFSEMTPTHMPVDVALPAPFTLGPGESKTVEVTFSKPPAEWNESMLPLYGGKIFVNGTNNESLSVPYFGLASDLRKEMDDLFMDGYPIITTNTTRIDIHQKPNWTNSLWDWSQDWPALTIQLKWGTRELRWDLYEPGFNESMWEYPPTMGRNGYLGSATSYANSYSYFQNDPENTFDFPQYGLSRNGITTGYRHTFWWFGKMTNGTQIEPGFYDMRVAALKPFGDPATSEDWYVYDTPTVNILAKYGPNPWVN
ncbi:subtilase [Stachybotrys elegans]|uniref:Subtilase n=1 Tax=Stachybotrys elegans TaxID=80388 RepID=A0A8K0SKC0_9HYPO|nr:subtilase [Stachybotrys elegans]